MLTERGWIVLAVSLAILGFVLISWRPTNAQGDITAPVLVDLSIEPQTVNTQNGSQVLTATFTVADDLSGVSRVAISFVPYVGTTQNVWVDGYTENMIAGDSLQGTYVYTFTIPQFAAEGRWIMRQVTTSDVVGNEKSIYQFSEDYSEIFRQYYFINVADNVLEIYLPTISQW